MEERVAHAEDLPPLELRELRVLDLDEPSAPGGAAHVAAASGVVRRAEYVYVIGDDELHLAVFDATSGDPGTAAARAVGRAAGRPGARAQEAKPDLEALTALPPFEGHPHGALLGLGSGSTPERDRGFAWSLAPDGGLDGEPVELDLAPLYELLRDEPRGAQRGGRRGDGRRALAASARQQRDGRERRRRALLRRGDRVALARTARWRPRSSARAGFDLGELEGMPAHLQRRQRPRQRAARVHRVGRGLERHVQSDGAVRRARWSERSTAAATSAGCGRSTRSTRSRECTPSLDNGSARADIRVRPGRPGGAVAAPVGDDGARAGRGLA